MKAHTASTCCTPSSAMLTSPARLLYKLRAVKSLQAPRLRRSCKQLAAVQSSEMLVNRVPASTAQQQGMFLQVQQDEVPCAVQRVLNSFHSVSDPKERYKLLLRYAKKLPALDASHRVATNRVMGCTSEVFMTASLDEQKRVQFAGDSNSELTRGLCAVLIQAMSGLTPAEVLQVKPEMLLALNLGPAVMAPSRTNGFLNMLETMRKRTVMLTEQLPKFPSLHITGDAVTPQGSFAEAQAKYLSPDASQVDALVQVLSSKKIGIVAHFYMDPEVQGVLTSAAQRWPHIHISDSLVMADRAVKMVEEGCTTVAVLGVDFMSENVRAILNEAGHQDAKVYRMDAADIGCSLAEAAETPMYNQYLAQAAQTDAPAMHVVYINTSLKTKAQAHAVVPTITCTSSNVVQTVLQGFAQIPDLTVWYGPDTYMGRNLAQLFTSLADMPDEEVRKLHPKHTQASVKALLPRLHYFEEGTCIVHHIFGGEVTELVRKAYGDAYLTAHFEVPGEMFTLAMEAKETRDMGVVGSTSNILDFIAAKVKCALDKPFADKLQFVLGTESGMITSIVRKVQGLLQDSGRKDLEVEIVFPVSPESITTSSQSTADKGAPVMLPGGLSMIPGPASGEGCSTEGGCASCPYMKMNSLSALMSVCNRIDTPGEALLEAYKPRAYTDTVNGRSIASAGCEPILHMRAFQSSGQLPDGLVDDIMSRAR
ncbi:hypothetical protein ABBQ38_006171 [Trebouxia sp. C0009 RCD-2024]